MQGNESAWEAWRGEWFTKLGHLRACRAHADHVPTNIALGLAAVNTVGLNVLFRKMISLEGKKLKPPGTEEQHLGRMLAAVRAFDTVMGDGQR